jgi:hypothetical protein
LKKYYEEAKYNAAFDRCIDVMARLIEKYGPSILENHAHLNGKADTEPPCGQELHQSGRCDKVA